MERVSIPIVDDSAQLQLVETHDATSTTNPNVSEHANGNVSIDGTRKEFAVIHYQLFGMQRQISNVLSEVLRSRTESQRDYQKVLTMLRRIARQPVACPVQSHPVVAVSGIEEVAIVESPRAILSKRPKDLYKLWTKYEFGPHELKPAKEFTASEREANEFSYSRRKIFWNIIAGFVRAGYISDVAIDNVYAAYGRQLSVTRILLPFEVASATVGTRRFNYKLRNGLMCF